MLYHASNTGGLQLLMPHASNHGQPLVYLSAKRENVLVYLSNAVERHCRENGFEWHGPWHKWASYGFTKEGLLQLEEYYPNALIETYQGVSGYIYHAENVPFVFPQKDIRDAFVSEKPVQVAGCEWIPDALEALLLAREQNKLIIKPFEEMSTATREWLAKVIPAEYAKSADHPEYRFFLQSKFSSFLPG